MKIIFGVCVLLLGVNQLIAQQNELDSMRVQVEREVKLLSAKYDQAEAAYEAAASEHEQDSLRSIVSAIHNQLSAYDNMIQKRTLLFIAAHPDSYTSASQLRSFVQILPLDTLQKLYQPFTPRIKQSSDGKAIAAEIKLIVAASPGNKAIDFKTVDIHHKPLQLSSFRGTVVLLDFWASWCVPCRISNPHLITLYNKYKSKGFTIIGVADDERQRAAWYKAVEKDKIGIWHHVLKGNLNHQFAIYSLPVKILIDKNGVIIGRYSSIDEAALEKKLAEIL
jgi:thiol-disulfide isomerase/thioredoxin